MRAHIFGQSAKAKEGATRSFAVSSFREDQKTLSAGIKNICGGDGIGFYGVFTLFALTSEI